MSVLEATRRSKRRSSPFARRLGAGQSGALLLLPALIALTLLFFVPIIHIAITSVTQPEVGFGNYVALITDGYSFRVIIRTLIVSVIVAAVGGLLSYPYAYAMTIVGPTARSILFMLVLVPLWTSMMARNFAWVVLLRGNGPVADFFDVFGVDMVLFGTPTGVTLAMTQVLLPFIVLPMYSSMQQIDRRLLNAGHTLGANRLRSFWKIYFPLSLPGVIGGVTLAFVLALGFFITPALIGRPQQALIAQLIRIRVGEQLDFGGAGALGVVLLVVTLLVMAISSKLAKGPTAPTVGVNRVGVADQNGVKRP